MTLVSRFRDAMVENAVFRAALKNYVQKASVRLSYERNQRKRRPHSPSAR
jgi:hypothetical protein